MTENQWKKLVDRLHKYRIVKTNEGDTLILWDNGDVSLRAPDGHCIACYATMDLMKPLFVY